MLHCYLRFLQVSCYVFLEFHQITLSILTLLWHCSVQKFNFVIYHALISKILYVIFKMQLNLQCHPRSTSVQCKEFNTKFDLKHSLSWVDTLFFYRHKAYKHGTIICIIVSCYKHIIIPKFNLELSILSWQISLRVWFRAKCLYWYTRSENSYYTDLNKMLGLNKTLV